MRLLGSKTLPPRLQGYPKVIGDTTHQVLAILRRCSDWLPVPFRRGRVFYEACGRS
jgi:hypothetical protein